MASLSKSQAQKIASEVGGTVRSSANGGYKVEYQVRGNGTKSTRYIIRPDQAPNLTPHARETDNASDPANKAAQKAVRTGTAIADIGTFTPNSLSPVKPLNLPTPPLPGNPGDVVGSNNSSLIGGLAGQGYSLDGKGQFSYSAPAQGNGFEDIFKSYLGNQEAPPSLSSIYDKLEKDNKIRQKEAAVQSYTNQINSITSKAQAESLALEGQGRGITESIIGGQQAKINREAAIQALPVQAQLAAATGDLESARNFVAQKFQLLAQDAQAQYQYKQRLVDAVYNFANAQQQRQLDALQKKEDQAFSIKMKELDLAQQKELISYKAGLEGGGGSTPTVKTINGVDYQWNPSTQKWETPSGTGGTGGQTGKSVEQLDFLLGAAKDAKALSGESGQGAITKGFGDLVGGSKYRQLEAYTNTLKTNMLTLATDPSIKKFFGPQMSNADVLLMTSAGTTLNPEKQSPTQLKQEVERIENFLSRAKAAVDQGQQAEQQAITGGGYMVMTSDGPVIITQ